MLLNLQYKVLISVCLVEFVCPIITQEPLDWAIRENQWNVLSLVMRFLVEWVNLKNENVVSQ